MIKYASSLAKKKKKYENTELNKQCHWRGDEEKELVFNSVPMPIYEPILSFLKFIYTHYQNQQIYTTCLFFFFFKNTSETCHLAPTYIYNHISICLKYETFSPLSIIITYNTEDGDRC